MAHTNQTAHYHLPQYVGTDIINPLTDTNGAYEAIDTAIYEVGQTVSGMSSDIDALKIQNGDNALDTTAQTLSGAINELKSGEDALGVRVTANETDISTLQTQMSTATGNITTLNTSVAGLQTEMAGKASATALNNLTTKVGTGNLNTTAQNCVDAINEVLADIPSGGGTASSVSYDNTTSGLTATNVQSAIDEIAQGAGVPYDVINRTEIDITAITPGSFHNITLDAGYYQFFMDNGASNANLSAQLCDTATQSIFYMYFNFNAGQYDGVLTPITYIPAGTYKIRFDAGRTRILYKLG